MEEVAKLFDEVWDNDLHEAPLALVPSSRGALEEGREPGADVVPDVLLVRLYLEAAVAPEAFILEDFVNRDTIVLLFQLAVVRHGLVANDINGEAEAALHDEGLDVDTVIVECGLDIKRFRSHNFPYFDDVLGLDVVDRIRTLVATHALERFGSADISPVEKVGPRFVRNVDMISLRYINKEIKSRSDAGDGAKGLYDGAEEAFGWFSRVAVTEHLAFGDDGLTSILVLFQADAESSLKDNALDRSKRA